MKTGKDDYKTFEYLEMLEDKEKLTLFDLMVDFSQYGRTKEQCDQLAS